MKTYVTVLGDTFDKIALDQFGSEYLFPLLLKANPMHRNTLIFSAGIKLIIPEVKNEDYPNLPQWMEGNPEDSDSEETILVLNGVDA